MYLYTLDNNSRILSMRSLDEGEDPVLKPGEVVVDVLVKPSQADEGKEWVFMPQEGFIQQDKIIKPLPLDDVKFNTIQYIEGVRSNQMVGGVVLGDRLYPTDELSQHNVLATLLSESGGYLWYQDIETEEWAFEEFNHDDIKDINIAITNHIAFYRVALANDKEFINQAISEEQVSNYIEGITNGI